MGDFNSQMVVKPSFNRKVNADWTDVISDTLNIVCQTGEKYCKEPGVGVAGGASPSGGAPIGKYPNGSGKVGGTLRRGHHSDLSNPKEKMVKNNTEYWPYVVFGTSKMSPNDYPTRVVERIDKEDIYKKALLLTLRKKGIL
jgi:hypothetical protein